MKRYDCELMSSGYDLYSAEMVEEDKGDWVKAEDALALERRVAELEADAANMLAALEEIGCRTYHGIQPEPCPICQIVDRVIKNRACPEHPHKENP